MLILVVAIFTNICVIIVDVFPKVGEGKINVSHLSLQRNIVRKSEEGRIKNILIVTFVMK